MVCDQLALFRWGTLGSSLRLVKSCKGSQCNTAGSPSNSFKQDWIFGTYKINFIIHSLHVYILLEFLNNGIVNTPKLILIILTGATIHFCQVQVSKYNSMWKAIFFSLLNRLLCYLQHKKESRGPRGCVESQAGHGHEHTNTGEEVASGLGPGGCGDLCGQSIGGRDDGGSSNVSQRLRGGHWGDACEKQRVSLIIRYMSAWQS